MRKDGKVQLTSVTAAVALTCDHPWQLSNVPNNGVMDLQDS